MFVFKKSKSCSRRPRPVAAEVVVKPVEDNEKKEVPQKKVKEPAKKAAPKKKEEAPAENNETKTEE